MTLRERLIRQSILTIVNIVWHGNSDVAILDEHIFQGLSTGQSPYMDEEIMAALADLVERRLITVENVPASGRRMPAKGYRSTPRSRDFERGNFPWELLDDFAARQRP